MIANVRSSLEKKVKHRIWLFSDLQQKYPQKAKYCMELAVNDYKSLGCHADFIWYLGDGIEGIKEELLQEAVQIQLDLLQPLGIPLRYVLGNHDFDYGRSRQEEGQPIVSHLHQAIQAVPGWKTIDSLQSFYFMEDLGDFQLLFLSDHGAKHGEWISTHGIVHGKAEQYPFPPTEYKKLRDSLAASSKPVISLSHYAFEGGNRASALYKPMLPLPEQVKIHFYGHSHIGDAVWGKEHLYRKIAYVDHQSIPQINVSSLENDRGDEIRSVFFEIYEDHSFGIYFRDHSKQQWAGMLMLPGL